MKTKRNSLVILALFAILVPMHGFAKNPDPFMGPTDTKSMSEKEAVQHRYALMVNLPKDSNARKEFFRLAKENTGFNEEQLTALVRAEKVKIGTCPKETCKLLTAGLVDGKAVWWRLLNENEEFTYFEKGNFNVPFFVLSCDNPLKPPEESEESVTMAPTPPTVSAPPPQQRDEILLEQMICVQSGPVPVVSDTTFYSGHSDHQFNGLYNPTSCFKVQEKIFLERGSR